MGNLISTGQLRNTPLISPAFGVINSKHGRFNIQRKIQHSPFASVNFDACRYVDQLKYFLTEVKIKMRRYRRN